MNILAINGSHRGSRGFTYFCIEKIFDGARKSGAECECVNLSEVNMNPCMACNVCHTEKSYLRCKYEDKDDVRMVFDKMKNADIIIYASPIYIFTISGLMKTFLDRINSTGDSSHMTISDDGLIFHQIDYETFSKPYVTLICCDNIEDETPKNAVEYFKTFGSFMNAKPVGCLIRKGGKLIGHGKDIAKESEFPLIQDVFQAFTTSGSELATIGRIKPSTEKMANKNIIAIPLFIRLLMKIKPFKKRIFYSVIQKRMSRNEVQ